MVIFAYRSTAADNEPEAVRDALAVADRARSGNHYALIGASLGGRVVIEAAATRPSGLAWIVSLSGERTIQNDRDILPDARKVTSPALYVGAKDDFVTQGERQQRQLHEAMRGKPNILLQRDGLAHGMDLINPDGPDGKAVTPGSSTPSNSSSRPSGLRHPHQHSTFMVVRPKARHNHPMTVRGYVTADGQTLEHGRFDVRLDELRTVHEATLPVALER